MVSRNPSVSMGSCTWSAAAGHGDGINQGTQLQQITLGLAVNASGSDKMKPLIIGMVELAQTDSYERGHLWQPTTIEHWYRHTDFDYFTHPTAEMTMQVCTCLRQRCMPILMAMNLPLNSHHLRCNHGRLVSGHGCSTKRSRCVV